VGRDWPIALRQQDSARQPFSSRATRGSPGVIRLPVQRCLKSEGGRLIRTDECELSLPLLMPAGNDRVGQVGLASI